MGPMSKAYKACPGPTRRLIPQAGVRLKRPVDASAPVTDRLRPLHEIDNGWDGSREEAGSAGGPTPVTTGRKANAMKTNVRLLLLALLAATALCAAAAAPASASEFLIEGQQISTPANVEGTSSVSLLSATIAGVKAEIECPEDTFTGKIEAGGRGSATLTLKKCKEAKPAKCSVAETLETKLNDKLIGTGLEVEFEPPTPEGNFFEVSITGSECAIKGTYKITGAQGCELPKAEEELVEHEIACPTVKSKLKVLGGVATFSTTEKAKLASGKKWSTAALEAGKLLSADFKGNKSVLVDHTKNLSYGETEAALSISSYGAKNEVEWEANRSGVVQKIWMPTYVLGETVKLEAQFAVEKATKEYLEANAEEVELKGETTVAGGSFNISKGLSAEEIKLQFEKHSGYLSTEVRTASAALVKKVAKSLATMTWKWKVTVKGRPTPIEQGLGKNTNTYYTIYSAPVSEALIYLTLLDVATEGIGKESEPLTESKLISGVWAGFSNKQKEAGCLTLECPILRIRTYNPANGEIKKDGNPLLYYEPVKTGLTLTQYETAGARSTHPQGKYLVHQLLEALTGECGSWARAFRISLAIEGVKSLQLRINPKFPSTPANLPCQTHGQCIFLVKTWSFSGSGTSTLFLFPFTEGEVTDQNGATGQGVENPDSAFQNHQLVEVGNKLYDPSYGTAPVGAGNSSETAFNLGLYREKNISGFCEWNGSVYSCALPVANRQGLEATTSGLDLKSESEEEEGEPEALK